MKARIAVVVLFCAFMLFLLWNSYKAQQEINAEWERIEADTERLRNEMDATTKRLLEQAEIRRKGYVY